MKTRLDNLETFLFVALLLALSVALSLGAGATWFGRIPLFIIVFYAVFGTLLILARYRTLGRNAHTLSLLMLLAPFGYILVARAMFEALPMQFPTLFKGFMTYSHMIFLPMYLWSRHVRLSKYQ